MHSEKEVFTTGVAVNVFRRLKSEDFRTFQVIEAAMNKFKFVSKEQRAPKLRFRKLAVTRLEKAERLRFSV